jgi:protein-S-isoprenylcysteine O-methyltransferase Ste14
MSGENVYRSLLLALMLSFFPIGLYFRLRSFTGEPLSRRDEGLAVMVGLRLAGLAAMLGIICYLINPSWMEWAAIGLPAWLRLAGLPLGILAEAWLFWMLRTLGPNLTDTVNVRANATLVTDGPYRWVRHPMYLGVAVLILAVSLLSASAFMAIGGGLCVAMQVRRTRTEEAKLVERFGEAYRQYASRTGRFLPW